MKKYIELTDMGTEVSPPEPARIYFGKEKEGIISVEWRFEWFEKPEKVPRNGRG